MLGQKLDSRFRGSDGEGAIRRLPPGTKPKSQAAAGRLTEAPTPRESPRDVDRENAKLSPTSTVRGWETLPVFTR